MHYFNPKSAFKNRYIGNLLLDIYGIRFLGIKIHFVNGMFSDMHDSRADSIRDPIRFGLLPVFQAA